MAGDTSPHQRQVSAERIIAAPAQAIFDVLVDPSRHHLFDGSGTVKGASGEQTRLRLGSTFAMSMRIGVPYRTKNRVLEFDENRLIAWAHLNRHRWRYELEPQADGTTLVRETFDYSTAIWPKALELAGFPKRNLGALTATLERLAALVETETGQVT